MFKNLGQYFKLVKNLGEYGMALAQCKYVQSLESGTPDYRKKVENALARVEKTWPSMPTQMLSRNPSKDMATKFIELRKIQTELDNRDADAVTQKLNHAILYADTKGLEQGYGVKHQLPDA